VDTNDEQRQQHQVDCQQNDCMAAIPTHVTIKQEQQSEQQQQQPEQQQQQQQHEQHAANDSATPSAPSCTAATATSSTYLPDTAIVSENTCSTTQSVEHHSRGATHVSIDPPTYQVPTINCEDSYNVGGGHGDYCRSSFTIDPTPPPPLAAAARSRWRPKILEPPPCRAVHLISRSDSILCASSPAPSPHEQQQQQQHQQQHNESIASSSMISQNHSHSINHARRDGVEQDICCRDSQSNQPSVPTLHLQHQHDIQRRTKSIDQALNQLCKQLIDAISAAAISKQQQQTPPPQQQRQQQQHQYHQQPQCQQHCSHCSGSNNLHATHCALSQVLEAQPDLLSRLLGGQSPMTSRDSQDSSSQVLSPILARLLPSSMDDGPEHEHELAPRQYYDDDDDDDEVGEVDNHIDVANDLSDDEHDASQRTGNTQAVIDAYIHRTSQELDDGSSHGSWCSPLNGTGGGGGDGDGDGDGVFTHTCQSATDLDVLTPLSDGTPAMWGTAVNDALVDVQERLEAGEISRIRLERVIQSLQQKLRSLRRVSPTQGGSVAM
jgi:hypothetical protein